MSTGKLYERVAVKLSEPTLLALGKEQAAKHQEYLDVQAEKAEALNTFNARLKTIEAEIDDIAKKINSQHEEKDIEIREEPDYGRKIVVKVRADNGQPIGQRPMTLNEEAEGKMVDLRAEQDGEDGEAESSDAEAAGDGEEPKPKGRRSRRKAEATEDAAAEE